MRAVLPVWIGAGVGSVFIVTVGGGLATGGETVITGEDEISAHQGRNGHN